MRARRNLVFPLFLQWQVYVPPHVPAWLGTGMVRYGCLSRKWDARVAAFCPWTRIRQQSLENARTTHSRPTETRHLVQIALSSLPRTRIERHTLKITHSIPLTPDGNSSLCADRSQRTVACLLCGANGRHWRLLESAHGGLPRQEGQVPGR